MYEPKDKLRKIIHIDMDAFFAAVEVRNNPKLRGLPIAVGGDGKRGVIATASYEARRFGVHSALSTLQARRLCPELLVIEPHFDEYKAISAQIREIFHDYTDVIEPLSIDEAFLDVTANKKGEELAVNIARKIKQRIREETSLTASAGVSYNKFLAKIASDLRKPDGLCTIHPSRALSFIDSLEIEQFWGVGPKTAEKFHAMGISNGKELRACGLQRLVSAFGKMGRIFYQFARGRDDRPVREVRPRRSVSCENTFERDLDSLAQVSEHVELLSDDLAGRINRTQFEGRTLTLKVKFFDFTRITRSLTAAGALTDFRTILPLALSLTKDLRPSEKPIRLLGLCISNQAGNSDTSFPHATDGEWEEGYQLEFEFKGLLD